MPPENYSAGEDCGPPRMMPHERRTARPAKPLNLTDAQKKQIAAIIQGQREKTSSL